MSRTEKTCDVEHLLSGKIQPLIFIMFAKSTHHSHLVQMFTELNLTVNPTSTVVFLINFKLCCIATIRISMFSGLVTWTETKYLHNTKPFSLNCLVGLGPTGY
jgi:hypothetical protein